MGGMDETEKAFRVAKFWANVDRADGDDSCWLWTAGGYAQTGYGQATTILGLPGSPNTRSTTAHRQAWIITNGDPGVHSSPKDGRAVKNRVLHRCPGGSNRLCCNPAHLAVGTDKDNADDRASEGHTFRGEQVTIHVLAEANVREALELYGNGSTMEQLAARYEVNRATIASMLHGETWAHVDPETPRFGSGRRRHSKLSERIVREALAAHANGASCYSLAKKYGVSMMTMSCALHGDTWKDVAPEIPRRQRRQPNGGPKMNGKKK